MDKTLEEMLEEAVLIRRLCVAMRDHCYHAEHMAKMIEYGQARGLLWGDALSETASEEAFAVAVEFACGVLELFHGETIGSAAKLSREEKMEIVLRAKKKAEETRFNS